MCYDRFTSLSLLLIQMDTLINPLKIYELQDQVINVSVLIIIIYSNLTYVIESQ